MTLPWPSRKNPGIKDAIQECNIIVGSVTWGIVLNKYSASKGKANWIMANLLPNGPTPLPFAQHPVRRLPRPGADVLMGVVGLVPHHVGAKHKVACQ